MSLNTKHFPTSHGKNGGGGGVTYINGGGGVGTDLNVNTINANKGRIGELTGASLVYNDGNFLYVGASDGTISKLKGNDLNYQYGFFNSLEADDVTVNGKITTNDLKATTAFIEALSSKEITTEYLTVTKSAHFFELIIDKVKSVGGSMMMTCANSIIDYVKAYDANNNEVALDANDAKYYKVWFRATDSDGRQISNDWQEGDQAICQSFNNITGPGTYYDVSNKYYWRLVEATLDDKYINFNTGEEMAIGPQGPQGNINANEVEIINPYITWTPGSQGVDTIQGPWVAEAQQTAIWVGTQGMQGTQGTLTTFNTIFGVQFSPDHKPGTSTTSTDFTPYDIEIATPQTFGFQCSNARLNVGLFYTDGKYDYFPAPASPQTTYSYNLPNANNAIQSVIISNADEVAWRLCHGIQLSNTVKDGNAYDGPQGPQGCQGSTLFKDASSIPSSGDNIIQLGNRGTQGHQADPERQSAIIIAAYRSPDNGNPNGTPPLGPIQAPSYAQYVGINDFNLGAHRHTYIDRNGSMFIGDFYSAGGDNIVDMINDVSTNTNIYAAYATLTQYQNQQFDINPQAGVAYDYIGFAASPATSQATLTFADYDWIYIPGGSAASGNTPVNAYTNVQIAGPQGPEVPPAGTVIDSNHSYTMGPAGNQYTWTYTAETPDFANGYYTWMTQTTLYGATGTYGTWSPAARITGDNGKDGEDGNITEFIYKSFAGPQTPSDFSGSNGPQNWNINSPDDPQGHQFNDRDYVGPTGHQWNDNPQGVAENMQYEYMSQRTYLGEVAGQQWTQFTDPVVWSHWGHEGRDGDGYEYIFWVGGTQGTQAIPPEIVYITPSINGVQNVIDDEYLPAGKQGPQGPEDWWSDDPRNLDAGKPYQWVAMRKKVNGEWSDQGHQGHFSTPTIWGSLGQGLPGAQGPQGMPGENESVFQLINMGSFSYIDTYIDGSIGQQGTEIKQRLHCNFNFKLAKIENDGAHIMSYDDVINYEHQTGNTDGLRLYMRLPYIYSGSTYEYKWVACDMYPAGSTSSTDCIFSFGEYDVEGVGEKHNIVDKSAFASSSWKDDPTIIAMMSTVQFKLVPGASSILKYNNGTVINNYEYGSAYYYTETATNMTKALDTYLFTTTLAAGAIRTNIGNTICDLAFGQQGDKQNIAGLTIRMDGIQTSVQGIQSDYVTNSQLNQKADSLTSTITAGYRDLMTNGCVCVIDLTGKDQSYFYPVSINLSGGTYIDSVLGHQAQVKLNNQGLRSDGYRFIVERTFDASYGVPNWANTHHEDGNSSKPLDGFTCVCDWHTVGSGWGTTWNIDGDPSRPDTGTEIGWCEKEVNSDDAMSDDYRFINGYEINWTNNDNSEYVLGDIRQNSLTSEEIICLRGGSKYNLHSSYWPRKKTDGSYVDLGLIVKVWDENLSSYGIQGNGYAWSNGEKTRVLCRHNTTNIADYIPVEDPAKKSVIEQKIDRISASVYGNIKNELVRTGIDITNGLIELNAINTNINGALNIRKATEGITVYDTSDNARINIMPKNCPSPSNLSMDFTSSTESGIKQKGQTDNFNAETGVIQLGTYAKGDVLSLRWTPFVNGDNDTSSAINHNTTITVIAIFIHNDTEYEQHPVYPSKSNGIYPELLNTLTIGNTQPYNAGSYAVKFKISSTDDFYTSYNFNVSATWRRTSSNLVYLGMDGLTVATSKDRYAIIGQQGYELAYFNETGQTTQEKGDGIKLNGGSLMRAYVKNDAGSHLYCAFDGKVSFSIPSSYSSSNWKGIGSDKHVYAIKAEDAYVYVNQSDANIILGAGIGGNGVCTSGNYGRMVTIVNLTNDTITVWGGYNATSTSTMSRIFNSSSSDYHQIGSHKSATFLGVGEQQANNVNYYWMRLY